MEFKGNSLHLHECSTSNVEAWFKQNYQKGHLPASVVKDYLKAQNLTIEQLLLALLPIAQSFANPSISQFCVGAVAQGNSGAIYLGANQEFKQQPLLSTLHAEQVVVLLARHYMESGLKRLTILHFPCGFCRQFLLETNPVGNLVIKILSGEQFTLSMLIPWSFSAKQLQLDSLFWKQPSVKLRLPPDTEQINDALVVSSLKAAESSHAPYSKAYSGIALELHTGEIISASYLENAAFNPSILPLEAALGLLRLQQFSFSQIKRVCLIQCKNACINQALHVKDLLSILVKEVELISYWAENEMA